MLYQLQYKVQSIRLRCRMAVRRIEASQDSPEAMYIDSMQSAVCVLVCVMQYCELSRFIAAEYDAVGVVLHQRMI